MFLLVGKMKSVGLSGVGFDLLPREEKELNEKERKEAEEEAKKKQAATGATFEPFNW